MKSSYFRLAFAIACTGIIVNAAAAQTVQFETSALLVNGTSMTVNVIITSAPSTPVTVQIGTLDGTAFSPGDYTAASGTLIFPAGSISPQSFTVTGINTASGGKQFYLQMSNLTGPATLGTALMTVTIQAALPGGGGGNPPPPPPPQPQDSILKYEPGDPPFFQRDVITKALRARIIFGNEGIRCEDKDHVILVDGTGPVKLGAAGLVHDHDFKLTLDSKTLKVIKKETSLDQVRLIWSSKKGEVNKKTKVRAMISEQVTYEPPSTGQAESVEDEITLQVDDVWDPKENPYKPDLKIEVANSTKDDPPGESISIKVKVVKKGPTHITQKTVKKFTFDKNTPEGELKDILSMANVGFPDLVTAFGGTYYEMEVSGGKGPGTWKNLFVREKIVLEQNASADFLQQGDLSEGSKLESLFLASSEGFIVGRQYPTSFGFKPPEHKDTFWDFYATLTKGAPLLKGPVGTTKKLIAKHYYIVGGKSLITQNPDKQYYRVVYTISNIRHPFDANVVLTTISETRTPD